MQSMGSGGGERSLLTLLTLLDYDKYDVDLFLFNPSGLFFDMLPKQVNVLTQIEDYNLFCGSPTKLLASGRLGLLASRLRYSAALRQKGLPPLELEQRAWKHLKKAFATHQFEYDAAIAYLEGNPIYLVADCVKAKTKIGYIHNDYPKLGLNPEFDRPHFSKLDYLVSVSPVCCNALSEVFPQEARKIRKIENIISPTMLKRLAKGVVEEYKGLTCKRLLTIGRLLPQKGYDLALDAAEKLRADGVDFKWFCIGKGELKGEIEAKIKEKQLEGSFILLGERSNPYPYLAGCDIYVQASLFEGKSIAIDEAKCLAKPIVATRFTTVFDQLEDEKTALLADMNGADIAEKIKKLTADEALKNSLSDNLKSEKLGNESELEKFYELIG